MASYPTSLNITPSASTTSRISLDHTHLTTLDFGQITPLMSLACLPRDKHNIKFDIYSRVSPLNFPAYLDANIVAVTAFVPYYQVFSGADAYFTGTETFKGRFVGLPFFTAFTLDSLFLNPTYNLVEKSTAESCNIFANGAQNGPYFKFTYKGRLFYKILRGLGYQLSTDIDVTGSTLGKPGSYSVEAAKVHLNALPLLCFAKLYADWFSSSYFYAASRINSTLDNIKNEQFQPSSSGIPQQILYDILNSIKLMYKNDYFTNAWRYSNSPIGEPNSDKVFNVPSSGAYLFNTYDGSLSIESNQNYTSTVLPREQGIQDSDSFLTAMQVRALNALDNYIRRNNYAGTKPALRALAKFGIKTDDFKSNYADVLDIKRIPLRIGDVTQTSETSSAPLGSFAGKAFINGDSSFSVQCSDYGHLFVVGYISIDTAYPLGYDREVLKNDIFDFYTPEFDGLGLQPISYNELVSDPSRSNAGELYAGNHVFGFTERFNDYRTSRDKITGDFVLYDDLYAWHAGREMSVYREEHISAQADEFIYYPNYRQSEFDRIFALTDADADTNTPDHFYLSCYFGVNSERPIKNSNQIANLGVGSVNIQKNGTHLE